MVTEKPRACSSLANEAEMIPFPSEEVTPPVTKMYLVIKERLALMMLRDTKIRRLIGKLVTGRLFLVDSSRAAPIRSVSGAGLTIR